MRTERSRVSGRFGVDRSSIVALALTAALVSVASAQLTPNHVLVVYDSRIPDSIEVAEYYAGSAAVPGGPSGVEPGARPGVHAVDLATLGGAVASTPDIAPATYLSAIRDPIRSYLSDNGLVFTVRCLVLTKGIAHRILDADDPPDDLDANTNPRPIGDRPRDLLAERLSADASGATVDSELCVLWQATQDTEGSMPLDSLADSPMKNPYFRRTQSITTFSNAAIQAPKIFTILDQEGATIGGDPTVFGASAFTSGDILLVTRLDGNSVADVKGMIDRSAVVGFDPASVVFVLDESGSEGVQDVSPDDAEIDNSPSALSMTDDYEAARDALLTDGRFTASNIRYDQAGGTASFLVGPLGGIEGATPQQTVSEPVALLASYNSNHQGGALGGGQTARRLAETFNLAPDSIFNTLESFNGRAFGGLGTLSGQEQCADFIELGGTFAVGSAFEPLSDSVPENEMLVRNFVLGGMTWAEAAWSAIPAVSWAQLVIGDPLATAVVGAVPCNPADQAPPIGVLDVSDTFALVTLIGAGAPIGEYDGEPGVNIFDLLAGLALIDEGCP